MIRDRIVVGIRDTKLSEKLQLNSELTLDRVMTEVRQSETVRKQQALLRGESQSTMGDTLPVGAILRR